jgi:hypothetical protein
MESESAWPESGRPDSAPQPTVGRRGRALTFIIGISLVGAGSVSAFISSNGAGSLGLLIGGILLLIIGITGEPPTRLWMGDEELVFRELKEVRGQIKELAEQVSELFLVTMAPSMYENLKKLASGNFGKYEMSGGLERELIHLRDIGYIENIWLENIWLENIWLENIPDEGPNLSPYVTVTDVGRRFVHLRESRLNSKLRVVAEPRLTDSTQMILQSYWGYYKVPSGIPLSLGS